MSSSFQNALSSLLWKVNDSTNAKEHSSILTPEKINQINSPFQFGLELEYHQKRLKAINPAIFLQLKLSDAQKQAYINELEAAVNCFDRQIQVELNYGRYRQLADIQAQSETCIKYIRILKGEEAELLSQESQQVISMCIGLSIIESFKKIKQSSFQHAHDILDPLNACRLYWVWGGSLLQDVLHLLSGKLLNIDIATRETSAPSYSLGMLSWILYYTTFFLDVYMLCKHTIPGPWMTEEEKNRPISERFLEQWHLRKHSMINDLVWATANLVCFYWLKGDGFKGHAGDAGTVVLLVVDCLVSLWLYMEEKRLHEQAIITLTHEIEYWNKGARIFDTAEAERRMKIDLLEKMKAEQERDWIYRKASHLTNIYIAGAYVLACLLFLATAFPLPEATLTVTSVTASAACFLLAVAYNAISAGIDISRANAVRADLERDLAALERDFSDEGSEEKKRALFIQIQDTKAKIEVQQKQIRYTVMELARTIIVDSTLPLMVFALSVFVPLTLFMSPTMAGFLIIGLAFIISIASKKILEKCASPKEAAQVEYNEEDYQEYCDNTEAPEVWTTPKPEEEGLLSSGSFFTKRNTVQTAQKDPGSSSVLSFS